MFKCILIFRVIPYTAISTNMQSSLISYPMFFDIDFLLAVAVISLLADVITFPKVFHHHKEIIQQHVLYSLLTVVTKHSTCPVQLIMHTSFIYIEVLCHNNYTIDW